jgi:hypothetical protein
MAPAGWRGAPLIAPSRDVHGGAGVVAVTEPIACPGCQRAVMLLVNRGGSTRCVECDEQALTPAGAPPRAVAGPPVFG